MKRVFIGFDCRMPTAYSVAVRSLLTHAKEPVDISALLLPHFRGARLYDRPTSLKSGVMFDEISQAPMSTEFAISRFLVPHLCNYEGWAVFCDSDFMFFDDIENVFALADDKYAVMCVPHTYDVPAGTKMDGQVQTSYGRKNWSSFMLFNCAHPANKFLTPASVNAHPGRDLHRFCWLEDSQIGALPEAWNWLEGHSSPAISPKAVHFTRGTPDMPGYENVPYADIWNAYAKDFVPCKVEI